MKYSSKHLHSRFLFISAAVIALTLTIVSLQKASDEPVSQDLLSDTTESETQHKLAQDKSGIKAHELSIIPDTAQQGSADPIKPIRFIQKRGFRAPESLPNNSHNYLRSRYVHLDRVDESKHLSFSKGDHVQIQLFNDLVLEGKVQQLHTTAANRYTISGTLKNNGGDFIIAYNNGTLAAGFHTPGMGRFRILPANNGLLHIVELSPDDRDTCGVDKFHDPRSQHEQIQTNAEHRVHHLLSTQTAADTEETTAASNSVLIPELPNIDASPDTTIDILALYSPQAATDAGGTLGIQAIIDLSIARANMVYQMSGVSVALQLVHSAAVSYTESGDLNTDLTRLSGTTDGFMDSIHATRDSVGADLVSLFLANADPVVAGLAYIDSNASTAFSVVEWDSHESTFAHEIGHNFGCRHDDDPDGAAYAHGYVLATPQGTLQTLMATQSSPIRIPRVSNPSLNYLETATGNVTTADNAREIRESKDAIAAFRSSTGNNPPTVSITSPTHGSQYHRLEQSSISITADASDSDGSVSKVDFYALKPDVDFRTSGIYSELISSDPSPAYTADWSISEPSMRVLVAAATDDDGAVSTTAIAVEILPAYAVESIPFLTGYESSANVNDISERNHVVGSMENASGLHRAFLWKQGDASTTELPPLAGHEESIAKFVSDAGIVYGESTDNDTSTTLPVSWDGSSATDLSTSLNVDGVTSMSAKGIDSDGYIYFHSTNGNRHYMNHAGTNTGFPSVNMILERVNDAGLVTGQDYNFGISQWVAFRWNKNGSPVSEQLTTLASHVSARGFDINRSGHVVGLSSPSPGWSSSSAIRATLWTGTAPIDLGTLSGGSGSGAWGINDHGEITGFSHTNGLTNNSAYLRTSTGTMIDLNHLAIMQDDKLGWGKAINNQGAIAAEGRFVPARAYFLRPVDGLNEAYWKHAYFSWDETQNSTISGAAQDPDSDGVINLLERAFGNDPKQYDFGQNGYPQYSINGSDFLEITFLQTREPSELSYTVETSSDMLAWTANTTAISRTQVSSGYDQVTYRSQNPIPSGGRLFIRVRVNSSN